jgi:hypothetical protein
VPNRIFLPVNEEATRLNKYLLLEKHFSFLILLKYKAKSPVNSAVTTHMCYLSSSDVYASKYPA